MGIISVIKRLLQFIKVSFHSACRSNCCKGANVCGCETDFSINDSDSETKKMK